MFLFLPCHSVSSGGIVPLMWLWVTRPVVVGEMKTRKGRDGLVGGGGRGAGGGWGVAGDKRERKPVCPGCGALGR